MSQRIDMATWHRRQVYAMYRSMANPFVAITAPVDATHLKNWCRESQTSLFAVALQRLTLAANEVPELRVRIREESREEVLYAHAHIDPAFTIPAPNGLFNFASVSLCDDPIAFAERVAAKGRALADTQTLRPFDDLRDDVFYLSCLPWMAFTQLAHPVKSATDSTPRIAWGKLVENEGKWSCPVNIQVHHGLADGAHLGAFFEAVQRQFDSTGTAAS